MAQDVRIKPNEDGLFDLVVSESDFEGVEGLETAIATSLFTDSRADSSRVQNPRNRRGWIGDVFTADINRRIGSQLWTIDQARLTQDTVNDAEVFARESLQWIIDDSLARTINVIVSQNDTRSITIAVEVEKIDGETQRYDYLWRQTDGDNITNI